MLGDSHRTHGEGIHDSGPAGFVRFGGFVFGDPRTLSYARRTPVQTRLTIARRRTVNRYGTQVLARAANVPLDPPSEDRAQSASRSCSALVRAETSAPRGSQLRGAPAGHAKARPGLLPRLPDFCTGADCAQVLVLWIRPVHAPRRWGKNRQARVRPSSRAARPSATPRAHQSKPSELSGPLLCGRCR